ncbi:hypothetical protein DXT71_31325, partial [Escherichia coli]
VGITIMADDVPVINFAPGTFKGSVVRLPAATGQNWQVMVSGFVTGSFKPSGLFPPALQK